MSAEPPGQLPGPWPSTPRPGSRRNGGSSSYPVRVYAYRLADRPGPSGRREYELLAETADLLELDEPFPVRLPIAEITP